MNFEHQSTKIEWVIKNKEGKEAFILYFASYSDGKQEWRLLAVSAGYPTFQDLVYWILTHHLRAYYGREDEMYWVDFWVNAKQPSFPSGIHIAHQLVTGGIGIVV